MTGGVAGEVAAGDGGTVAYDDAQWEAEIEEEYSHLEEMGELIENELAPGDDSETPNGIGGSQYQAYFDLNRTNAYSRQ